MFCGATDKKITGEHVFADWIGNTYFPNDDGTVELVAADGQVRSFPARPFTHEVRIACGDCNSGWMSRLEEKAQPFLKEMLFGRPVRLRPRDQKLLAFWAVKTALVLDHLHPRARVVPDAEYGELYAAREAREPSRRHMVWIGGRSVPVQSQGQQLVIAWKEPIRNFQADSAEVGDQILDLAEQGRTLYRVTFGLGALVVGVFSHDFPAVVEVSSPEVKVMEQIWPVTGTFRWPSTPSVDVVGGVEGVHRMFGGTPANPIPAAS
ncbi:MULTISPECIES: hypothetical protein [unclassified Frankia]|uniref:hypothetical protein n=1 Tax=unclassified Frankia TaxID=2632575 RepID=UPI0003F5D776|nr:MULTISPECIES: hypothetical protein [unclassified Frankia]OHV48512.1 hypothetical protein CgIS1_05745 [Frankia sp. CgIS1]